MKHQNISTLIGNTPLVKLDIDTEGGATIWGKLESFNPSGSIKDRPALYMIKAAEKAGILSPGKKIIEPSSGNMGISIAMLGRALGYDVTIVMPSSMSEERKHLIRAFGANLITTAPELGMQGTLDYVETRVKENKEYVYLKQFSNDANVLAHIETTSLEILKSAPSIDAFVAGVGTGGTLSGVGQVLKEQLDSVHVVAVEPKSSPLLSEGKAAGHKIQGIGANFVPDILKRSIIDEIVTISDEEAYKTTRFLARKMGMLCGISSGANVYAAIKIAKKMKIDQHVVVILPDTGERYLSTGVFNESD